MGCINPFRIPREDRKDLINPRGSRKFSGGSQLSHPITQTMALDSTQLVAPDIGALDASYDGKTLTLVASGRVDASICGITFIRLPVKSPELAFELRGWNSGVVPTNTKKHFHCTESFPIDLGGVYKGTVIIFDYNNPDGEEIRIEEEGNEGEELSPEGETSSKKSVQISTLLKDEYPKFSWAAPMLIRLDRGDPFVFETSCLASDPPALPTTSIAYDRTFFELRRALGHISKLEWFLTARQTGQTTVLTEHLRRQYGHDQSKQIYRYHKKRPKGILRSGHDPGPLLLAADPTTHLARFRRLRI
jgi:hypothetical protein